MLFWDGKMEKPDFIENFKKPSNTEFKCIGGRWYLYSYSNRYDPEKKRSYKVSGMCLGNITAEGVLVKCKKRRASAKDPRISDTVSVGLPLFLWDRTALLRERLQRYFPDLWKMLYVTALLRSSGDCRFKRLGLHYENSLLAYLFPGISFHPTNISELLNLVGKNRDAIRNFLQEDLTKKEAFILFDGHRLITASKTMEYAEIGYDSKMRYKPQVNLLYIFSLEQVGTPLYYKQYVGSTPDVSAFSDILTEAQITGKNYTVIADKAFGSQDDFALMDSLQIKNIIPLRRGNQYVKEKIPAGPSGYAYGFTYHGRGIHANTYTYGDFNVHLYLDSRLYSDEYADSVDRLEKNNKAILKRRELEEQRRANGKGKLTDAELELLIPKSIQQMHKENPEMGTVTIRTNRLDLNAQQVYEIYKQRQEIEQFFKTYGDTMEFEASYMRNTTTQEAWLFLNHLSSMIGIGLIQEIAHLGQSKNVSLKDLIQTYSKITASKINGKWQVAPIKKSVRTLLQKMGTTISDAEVEKAMEECSSTAK